MKLLDLVLDDVSDNEWCYQLYYMDKKYPFYLDLDPRIMSVLERHKAIMYMLTTVFREEVEETLNTRPRDTPEGRKIQEWSDMIQDMCDEMKDLEDDGEEDSNNKKKK